MLNNVKFISLSKKYILLILVLVSTLSFAQEVYQVESGVKGNKIILTIENASATLGINSLEIVEENLSEFIDIKNNLNKITNLAKESEKDIEIEFDVLREAPVGKKDTLHFVITNDKGSSWNKDIVLEYTPPKKFALAQNYPNPFNPSTTIEYSIPANTKSETANVKLVIYDILGREVTTLIDEQKKPGNYEMVFNANNLSSGVYLYRLSSGEFSEIKKLMLLK